MNYKDEVIKILKAQVDLDEETLQSSVEVPPTPDMGDYAFPTFRLAKTLRKAPPMIAAELAEKLRGDCFEKIEAKGAYVNFFVKKSSFIDAVIKEVYEKGTDYGSSDIGKGKTVVIDFSSPNIAKPFHIGHIRSTVIGNALYHIYQTLGYKVVGVNHLGDYGTQFGMLIAAFKLWGNKEEVEKDPINKFLELYVRFNKLQEEDPSEREVAKDWFKKLEDGDSEATELWQWMRDLSIREFNRVYEMLGIRFDSYNGEAFYSDKMPAVVEELKEKKLLTESDGAEIIDLEPYGLTPMLVIKSNGATTYATRDIAAAKYRKATYDFHKNIYVVAVEQNLHFKQLFTVLGMMGYEWSKDCVHVNFGMIGLEDGALSTREGKVLFLEDVLNKAVEKTGEIIELRNPNLENKEEVARQVGIGAVVFQELFNQRIKDYVFSWDKTLSFEGETGPYTQYTYARISSLLDKGGFRKEDEIDTSLIQSEEEFALLKAIYEFPRTISDAAEKNEPYFITRQVMEIAQVFNKYYNSMPILVEDEALKRARLSLCHITKTVLKKGLSILGVAQPERM